MNFNYQMRFSKTGRSRFIAHLDTLSCLVRAVRRTGYELAFTEGMRPKPILSLAMPLGVGVEGDDEICDFSLKQRVPLTDLAKKLSQELPEGMELKSVGPSYDRSKAAARVGSVSYRMELSGPVEACEEAIQGYNALDSLVLTRKRPKGDKEVDIKKFVDRVELDGVRGCAIAFDMIVTPEGTGRPEEIVEALRACSGEEFNSTRVVRTAISLKEDDSAARPRLAKQAPRRRRRLR